MKTTQVILSLSLFLSCILTGINAAGNSDFFDEKDLKTYLQPDDVGRNLSYDKLDHNNPYLCTRDCKKYPTARLCYYIFNVEHYSSMGPACRNCSTGNTTDCKRRQCIVADGFEKSVVSINRQIPGPTINVCYGDRIVVDVVNKLATSALTIHWHGVLQTDTPWMDGVPYVTQCPIQPNSMFRYNFLAETNGTLFYHAHIAHLHANGVYGALIVRHASSRFDPNLEFHDHDLPSHTIHIADWNHLPSEALFPGFYKNESHIPEKHDLLLINGHGWYSDAKVTRNVSLAKFHVECGKKYRFRIIASTTSTCSFRFAIQNHTMSVVALDGYPCNRTDVNTIVMSSGQRTDVIIKPQEDKNCQKEAFLIVVKGMDTCENLANAQTAYLIYHNATNLPAWPSNLATIHNKPPYLNNHQLNCTHSDNVCADTLPPATGYAGFIFNNSLPVIHSFIVQPGFHTYTLDELFETNTYNPFYVPFGPNGTFSASLNNVTGISPPVPLLTQENDIPSDMRICHNSCNKGEKFCQCINILEVGLNTIVEIQFQKSQFNIIHPIHLHGHHFTVVKPTSTTPTPFDFVEGQVQRDTVHAPLDGLARIKFLANNPGYWIMHCHFSPHLEGGMFLIFKVGNSSSFKPPPTGFPKCGNFKAPIKKF